MKTLYLTRRSAVTVDTNGEVKDFNSVSAHIDYIYIAPEDMQVIYNDKVLNAKKGDIIIKFYESYDLPNTVVIVKNKEWKENFIFEEGEIKKKQIDKESWAKKNDLCDCDCECSSCGC